MIDRIFRDPNIKHGLEVFKSNELKKLDVSEKSGKVYIKDRVTAKWRIAKPEEVVRQLALNWVIDDLSYPADRISLEVPVKMGATYADKAADIVIYTDASKITPYIIIEVKKPKRKDGLDQLESYMNATGVSYGAWINGNDAVYRLRRDPNLYENLKRLPAVQETLDDVKSPIRKDELEPIHDLKEEVQYLEDTVLANAGVSAFEEVFKLIFTKLWDEFDKGDADSMDFRITTSPPQDQYERINGVFKKAVTEWPDIFVPSDEIDLSPQALVAIASEFQTKAFYDADLDVMDAAFEYMINPEQKGDKGQYFTPRPIVKMCVRMLNPKREERIVDPACGPGGFLIHALHWVTEEYLRPKYTTALPKRKTDYATSRLFGLDFDQRLARVAKAMMLIAGDGRSNIYRVSSLDPREWKSRSDALVSSVKDGEFDIVMTNPPFAGKVSTAEVLAKYELAYKRDGTKKKPLSNMTRDVLFVERCLRLLKPGGRMAIVLPQGNFNNSTAEYIRSWVRDKARVLAVVGLHENTFKPFTNTKTSVLFLKKWAANEEPHEDYRIFMAVNERPVKDNSGNYVFRKDATGLYVLDVDGKRIIDHDLNDIAEAFVEFAKSEKLEFIES